jgi:hypothetical protein
LAALPPSVRQNFEHKGIMYVQNLHGGSGFGKSWQDTFETADRTAVESRLQSAHAEYEWRNGDLRIVQRRPSVITDRDTNEPVWFNQADQWHASNLDAETRAALLEVIPEEELPLNAYYGDGSSIPPEDLDEVRRAYREQTALFKWERGDFLVVDNALVAHGRRPYAGERKILLAMGS